MQNVATRSITRSLLSVANGKKKPTWSQNGAEVSIQIPVESTTRGRDLEVSMKPDGLDVKLQGNSLVSGSFETKIDPDVSFWSIEEVAESEKVLQLYLEKKDDYLEWEHLFESDLPPPANEDITNKVGRGSK
jgi:hypothetical protein